MTDVWTRMVATVFAFAFAIATMANVRAQDAVEAPSPPVSGMALSSAVQLDQMLAPIALYPDALVSQNLMAATYRDSGIMTFIVNQDGIVYQKDLGPKTRSLARRIREFDPGEDWKAVEAK